MGHLKCNSFNEHTCLYCNSILKTTQHDPPSILYPHNGLHGIVIQKITLGVCYFTDILPAIYTM